MINPGTQELVITETTKGSGTTSKEAVIQSTTFVASLWVSSVTSGSLSVTIYTMTDSGKEVEVASFPAQGSPTAALLLTTPETALPMSRLRVKAVYTGICSYEVYVRAVEPMGGGGGAVTIDGDVLIAGTDDGTTSGTQYTFVNNRRQQILAAHDLELDVTYANPATKAERITRIDFTSATFPGITIRKDISYTLVTGTKYIVDTIEWSVV